MLLGDSAYDFNRITNMNKTVEKRNSQRKVEEYEQHYYLQRQNSVSMFEKENTSGSSSSLPSIGLNRGHDTISMTQMRKQQDKPKDMDENSNSSSTGPHENSPLPHLSSSSEPFNILPPNIPKPPIHLAPHPPLSAIDSPSKFHVFRWDQKMRMNIRKEHDRHRRQVILNSKDTVSADNKMSISELLKRHNVQNTHNKRKRLTIMATSEAEVGRIGTGGHVLSTTETDSFYDYSEQNNELDVEGSDWQECWDEEVEAHYYYNTRTGEASWVNPSSAPSVAPGAIETSAEKSSYSPSSYYQS